MPGAKQRSGGARAGAGRPRTTYQLTETPATLLRDLAKKKGMHPESLLVQLILDAARQDVHPKQDALTQLIAVLTPEAQSIATICKRLRMVKPDLAQLISSHKEELIKAGMHLHTATASEIPRSIKLDSSLNSQEQTYYSKLSRNLFSLQSETDAA